MMIKKVEELVGIDRETIRFYIREGLLAPEQLKNRYREYTADDISQIKRIRVLRKMGMSIPEIRAVFNKDMEFDVALKESKEKLQKKQEELSASMKACDELMGSDPKEFDPLPYYSEENDE